MNKKVTASDVANYIGVSRSSVSRAFTEGASIGSEKRTLILNAAKELGYHPNFFARTLSTPSQHARSNLVAILISDFSNPYQSFLFEELSTALQKQGKQPMLLNIKQEGDLESALLRLSGYQVDGIIGVMGSLPAESLIQCRKLQLPLVTLARSDDEGHCPSVQTNNIQAGELAAEHFIASGLRQLGFVAGRTDGSASNERYDGFCKTIENAGLQKPIKFLTNSYSYAAGFEAGVRYIEQLRELDGVFCASDALAMGLLDSCQQVGHIQVPNQLKVIGCDNVPQAAWQGYQLTTVAQPVQEIVSVAIERLQQIWNQESDIPPMTRVKPILKLRITS
ncbi:MAG: LacI family DNA-binding transcriptional regulator [Vibrio sp.]